MVSTKHAKKADRARLAVKPGQPPLWRRPETLLALLLVLATFVAYWQVYGAGYGRDDGKVAEAPGFIWDDEDYVFQNPHLPDPNGLARIWLKRSENPQYYPLVFTTFWIEYRLWGGPGPDGKLKAAGYHFTNVLLHALNALLLWSILRRVRIRGAFAIAAIFALHPFCVESVAWVTERKNVLSLFFYLLAMRSLLRWEEEESKSRWGWWGLALGLFLCGLFSKTVIASLPVAMVILRWWRRRPLTREYLLALLPFLLLGFGMGRLTAEHEKDIVLYGDEGPYWDLSIFERVLIGGRALWFYVGKIVWPHPLVFNYPRWNIDAGSIGQWLWPIAALLAGAALVVLARRGRRGLLAAALFYAVGVFPALGFVNVAPMRFSFVADHFAYLPSIGVIAAVVGLAVAGLDRLRTRAGAPGASREMRASRAGWGGPYPQAVLVGLAVVLLVLGGLTWKQTHIYRDIEYLWRDTIAHYPESHLARINLGVLLKRRGEIDEARTHFAQVLADWPDWPWTRSRALTNLGNLEQETGRLDEAIRCFRGATEAIPLAPEPRFNLGNALLRSGRYEEAIESYNKLLERFPTHEKAKYNLALALEKAGQWREAQARYDNILRANPNSWEARLGAGRIAQALGNPGEALKNFQAAQQINPRSLAVHLALLGGLLEAGRRDEGLQLAAALLSGSREDPALSYEVAFRLREGGEHAEAVRIARERVAAGRADMRLKLLLVEELSAAPDASVRNGREALELALSLAGAETSEPWAVSSALALAYAETGRFPEAQAAMREAIAQGRERGTAADLTTLEERMQVLSAGQAIRLPR